MHLSLAANGFCESRAHEPADSGIRPSLTGIRGLVFDMGDVLYDATVWRRWLAHLLLHLGVQATYAEMFGLWDGAFLEDVHRGLRDYDDAFRAFLDELGLSHGQVDEVVAASAAKRRELAASLRPLPGVRGAIQRLHAAGYVLGVLSDSEAPAAVLRQRLAALGINEQFTAVLSSVELGWNKPDPRCYHAALAAVRLPPEQVAFVGHDAVELNGAAEVGMRTIAFNHAPEAEADVYLTRFDDLPCCLGPLSTLAVAG